MGLHSLLLLLLFIHANVKKDGAETYHPELYSSEFSAKLIYLQGTRL